MHKQDILKLLTFPGFKKLWCGGHTAYARTIFNHSRTYSSIFKTLVRGSSHSSTYSFISKFWCGGRATQAHILSFQNSGAVAEPLTHIFFHFKILVRWPSHLRTYFSTSKFWCGGRATHAHILSFQNSGAVAEPLTHIFFHFKILVRWPSHSRTNSFIFKILVRWPNHSRTYFFITKFWCGDRATHARVSPCCISAHMKKLLNTRTG